MNAITRFTVADEPPLAREYRRAITTLCGGNQDAVAMARRVDLCDLRDRASAALGRCSPSAAPILEAIVAQAGSAAFAPLSTRRLAFLACALGLTMQAAQSLEVASKA